MISAKNVFSDLYYSVTFHNFSLLSVNAALNTLLHVQRSYRWIAFLPLQIKQLKKTFDF